MRKQKPAIVQDDTTMSIASVAGLLNANRGTLRRWWASGVMPPPRVVGGRKLFLKSEIMTWLATLPTAPA